MRRAPEWHGQGDPGPPGRPVARTNTPERAARVRRKLGALVEELGLDATAWRENPSPLHATEITFHVEDAGLEKAWNADPHIPL